jgi:hypothetical protein
MPDIFSGGDAATFEGHTLDWFQQRVAGTCAAGNSIRVINEDGTVVCEDDTGFTLTTGDARYVNVTGDTMTGALTLPGNPTANLHRRPSHT